MQLPYNDGRAQKWAVEAEAICFLSRNSCDRAAIVYPVSIHSLTPEDRPEGRPIFGLLVVTHESSRPDRQVFLPILKRAGTCNVIGEAIQCSGIYQGITYRDLLRDPPQTNQQT